MILAMTSVDCGVLVLLLLAMLAVGWYFRGQPQTVRDFLFAGQSIRELPVGLSIAAAWLAGLAFIAIPGIAYHAGLKLLLIPLAAWLILPLLTRCVLPRYQRLGIQSVYEFLELRFDGRTRRFASLLFVAWRLVWLAGAIGMAGQMLVIASGGVLPLWLVLPLIGLVATAYTWLGGMKAVIWTDAILLAVLVAGLCLSIAAACWSLDGGSEQIWKSAVAFHRSTVADLKFSWANPWSFWALLPQLLCLLLAIAITDPISTHRWFTAKSHGAARRSVLLSCLALTIVVPGLVYLGLCLLAFFQANPQQMRPIWVANVDSTTRQSITDPATRDRPLIDPATGRPKKSLLTGDEIMDPSSGRPLIDWRRDPLDAATIEKLVGEHRLLHPNSKEPLADSAGLLDAATGELAIDKLAVRRGNEIVLHVRATDELLPRFIAAPHPVGWQGVMLALLFAAGLLAFNAGLNAIVASLLVDQHRRFGCGKSWLARRRNKPVDELTDTDELLLVSRLVLLVGLLATALSLAIAPLDDFFRLLFGVLNTFAAPLLAVFLLAMFTRRCTATAAFVALLVGVVFAIWFQLSVTTVACAWLWPLPIRLAEVWILPLTTLATFAVGLLLSPFLGQRKTRTELRGLVIGIGEPGDRREQPRTEIRF